MLVFFFSFLQLLALYPSPFSQFYSLAIAFCWTPAPTTPGGRQATTPGGEGLTFDGNMDALADGKLWLDKNTAQVLALIHAFLHVGQLESPVLKHHLAVVIRQQQGVLVPFDGVVGVANDPAVDECVPPSDGGDVPHCPDAGGSWGIWGKVERRGRWRHEPVPFCGGALLSCLVPEPYPWG